jgi:hypothetical protein
MGKGERYGSSWIAIFLHWLQSVKCTVNRGRDLDQTLRWIQIEKGNCLRKQLPFSFHQLYWMSDRAANTLSRQSAGFSIPELPHRPQTQVDLAAAERA